MVVLAFLLHDGQTDAGRLAAKQTKQALCALLKHIHMDIGNRYTQFSQTVVNCFLGGFAGEFLNLHQMPTSSALDALRSCCSKYLLKPICSMIA